MRVKERESESQYQYVRWGPPKVSAKSVETREKKNVLTSDVLLLRWHLVVVGRLHDGDVDVLK